MADSPEFTPGRRIKNGVIWHDSPSWTGPSSSQKIYSQRVPIKPISISNQKKSGENENYFEPPVDDEIFEDEEGHDSFDSMLSTKSQRSFMDQKSQKLVWKKDEDNGLLDDLKQGVEAGKRSLEKLKVLKKKKKSDESGSSVEVDVNSPKKTPMSRSKRVSSTKFQTPTHPLAHSTPKFPGIRVMKPVEPSTSHNILIHDSFDDSVDDLDYQAAPENMVTSPSTPRQKTNSVNLPKNKVDRKELTNLVFQTPSAAGSSHFKASINELSSRTISRGMISAISTPKSGRKRPASSFGTPVFKKAKSTEIIVDDQKPPSPQKSLTKSKSFQITVDDDWDDDSIFL